MKKTFNLLRKILPHIIVMIIIFAPFVAFSESLPPAPTGLRSPVKPAPSGVGSDVLSSGKPGEFADPIGATSLTGLLDAVLTVVIQLGVVVVVFFYIWAGFKFVLARGDTGKISEATSTLTWTTVGALVILGAKVISLAIQGTVRQLELGSK